MPSPKIKPGRRLMSSAQLARCSVEEMQEQLRRQGVAEVSRRVYSLKGMTKDWTVLKFQAAVRAEILS